MVKWLSFIFLPLLLARSSSTTSQNPQLLTEPGEGLFLHSVKGVKGALTYADVLSIEKTVESKCVADGDVLRYAEVGSYLGMSANFVAIVCPNSIIFCHDMFPESIAELDNNSLPPPEFNLFPDGSTREGTDDGESNNSDDATGKGMFAQFWEGVKRNKIEHMIVPMRGKSTETLLLHDDLSLDIGFVDGDHSFDGALADLRIMWKKLKIGGILLVHDAIFKPDGTADTVRQAVAHFSREIGVPFYDSHGTWGMVLMAKGFDPGSDSTFEVV